jgi:general secretion pathway protein K
MKPLRKPLRRTLRQQRGVAVITALLLTTLAISIVASLFWQQQVQVRSMENQRLQLQTQWIERGALDWASLVLQQDANDNAQTTLNQVWATPLAETRLDQYIERERMQGEQYDATLSGIMIDATSRYNLFNLAQGGAPDEGNVAVFTQLLKNLQIDTSLAKRTAQFVAASQGIAPQPPGGGPGGGAGGGPGGGAPGGAGGADAGGGDVGGAGGGAGDVAGGATTAPVQQKRAVMKLVQLDDLLAVPGWTPALVEKLRPFAIVLPAASAVNVNTAPAEVLASLSPALSMMEANALVQRRKQAPYKDVNQFTSEALKGQQGDLGTQASVKSNWFLVESHIKLDRATLNVQALVSRERDLTSPRQGPHVVWIRQI